MLLRAIGRVILNAAQMWRVNFLRVSVRYWLADKSHAWVTVVAAVTATAPPMCRDADSRNCLQCVEFILAASAILYIAVCENTFRRFLIHFLARDEWRFFASYGARIFNHASKITAALRHSICWLFGWKVTFNILLRHFDDKCVQLSTLVIVLYRFILHETNCCRVHNAVRKSDRYKAFQ